MKTLINRIKNINKKQMLKEESKIKDRTVITNIAIWTIVPFITGSVFVFFTISKNFDSFFGMVNAYPVTFAMIYFFGFGIMFLPYFLYNFFSLYKAKRSTVIIKGDEIKKGK